MITFPKYKILVDIFRLKIKNFSLSKIAREIDCSLSDPYFRDVFKTLLEEDCLIFIEKIGKESFYKLNRDKLDDFIRETEIFKYNGNFIKKSKPLDYNF